MDATTRLLISVKSSTTQFKPLTQTTLLTVLLVVTLHSASALVIETKCYGSEECREVYQENHEPCEGQCGRPLESDGSQAVAEDVCQACARRTVTDGYVCVPCTGRLEMYGGYYLISVLVLMFALHSLLGVAYSATGGVIFLTLWALMEGLGAGVLVWTAYSADDEWEMLACDPPDGLASWYPSWGSCFSEALYPLWTAPMVFIAILAGIVFVSRQLLAGWILPEKRVKQLRAPIHAILTAAPLMALAFALIGGVFYYVWPWTVGIIMAWIEVGSAVIRGPWYRFTAKIPAVWAFVRYTLLAYAVAALLAFFSAPFNAGFIVAIAVGPVVPLALFLITKPFTAPVSWGWSDVDSSKLRVTNPTHDSDPPARSSHAPTHEGESGGSTISNGSTDSDTDRRPQDTSIERPSSDSAPTSNRADHDLTTQTNATDDSLDAE